MRNSFFIIGVVFAATLAYIVGTRLSNEAMAVVVGALCGITASIPVSLALFIAASRNWGRPESPQEKPSAYAPHAYAPHPPVVVISPPQFNQSAYPFQSSQLYLPPHAPSQGAPREFKIIGDD